jgi:Holliday junction resolvasome RuvABC endonuclease subunit
MKTSEKRGEIYEFIHEEIITKKNDKWKERLSTLLKEYAQLVRENIPPQVIIKEKIVYKEKISPKDKPRPKKEEDNYWSL